jgi:DNA topoisomerase IB
MSLKKKLIRNAIKKTAQSLHHSPAICKSSYIYKKLLEKIESNKNIIKIFKKNINSETILKKYLLFFSPNKILHTKS